MHFRLTRDTQSEEDGRYVPIGVLNLRKDFFQMESLPKSFSWELLLMGMYCAWRRYRSGGTCRAIVADNTVFPWLCLVFSQMLLWKKGIFLKIEIDFMVLNKGNWKCGNDWSRCHNGQPFSHAFREQGQGILKVLQHRIVLHKENWSWPIHKCQWCQLWETRLRTRPVAMSRGRFSFNRSPSHYK